MKEFSYSLMIAYVEGRTSKEESKDIQQYIQQYPYYEDILCGLKQLKVSMNEEELDQYLQDNKVTARKQLFQNKNIPA